MSPLFLEAQSMRRVYQSLGLSLVAASLVSVQAQEISLPDPGLNAAIRTALGKPAGPLTARDLLSLTNLNASGQIPAVMTLEGLGTALNLVTLSLRGNQLTDFSY